MMNRKTAFILVTTILAVLFIACVGKGGNEIAVVSREDGSGTRGAFVEMFGIEEKDEIGNRIDRTTDEAIVVNSNSIVITTVAGDKNAIGYISLGSLNESVKAVKIDGAEATVDNIKNNTYKVFRPFIIASRNDLSDLALDFISFILSSDGQKVVEDNGYIAASDEGTYNALKPSGKIVISGSSSVTPVMEKLKEAYLRLNTKAEIEIQLSDSTTGLNSAMEGTCDIAMASRNLKDNELEKLKAYVFANDGLAVIVNKENKINNLTSKQVKDIFTGEISSWDMLTE